MKKTKDTRPHGRCEALSFNSGLGQRRISTLTICKRYQSENTVTLFPGDCLELLKMMPNAVTELVVTSPPYNLGKEYERRLHLDDYLQQQTEVIDQCVRVLASKGSICWQVGNYVDKGAIIPLDSILYAVFLKHGRNSSAACNAGVG